MSEICTPPHELSRTQQVTLGKLSHLFELNCNLLIVWGAAILYGTAARAGETLAILESVIVVLALTWEFMFSGEMLNEGEPESLVPRRARVLLYLGYLVLSLSVVLQLATLRSATTGAYLGVVSLDTIIEVGIVGIGVPLAIAVFIVGWFQEVPSEAAHDRDLGASGA